MTFVEFALAHGGFKYPKTVERTYNDGSVHYLLICNDGEWLEVESQEVTQAFAKSSIVAEEPAEGGTIFYRAYVPAKTEKDVLSMFK